MGYFKRFPVVEYGDSLLTDITTNIKVKREFISNIDKFRTYTIKDGETPEMLSYKIYGDYESAWIIIMFNNIISLTDDWPKTQEALEEWMEEEYGDTLDDVRVYVDEDGDIVPQDNLGQARAFTNREFEILYNEEKREIKIPDSTTVSRLKKQYRRIL